MKRREWLRAATGGLAGGLAVGLAPLTGAAARSGPAPASRIPRSTYGPIGLQLYTVRDLMADDVAGTLRSVAELGYEEVELAGLHGLRPGTMRRLLDDAGLAAPSAHVGLNVLRDDLDRALDDASATGTRSLVVPWLDPSERTADGYRRIADDLNRAGARARARGHAVGYHNHDFEMERLGAPDGGRREASGERPRGWDILLEETAPDLVEMQMDVFWAVHGGVDPVAYLEAHPGRFTSLHAKDRTADGGMVAVGDGAIDWAAVLTTALENGLEHVFVEHDEPADPLESIRTSFETLATLQV